MAEIRKRILSFRYLLPTLNFVAYIVLLQMSREPAHSPNVGFDPMEPLPHKIAWVLSAPTYFVALTVREWLGNYNIVFLNCCAALFGAILWYGIGYWLDCEFGLLPKPMPRKAVRLISAILLSLLVVADLSTWAYLLVAQRHFSDTLLRRHLLELSTQLVAWPLVFGIILMRILAYNGDAAPRSS